MSGSIRPLKMPKWGLSMTEGKVVEWLVSEDEELAPGQEVLEVETDKILASVESREAGVLRKKVARQGEVLPVGALLAVLAAAETPDSEIDSFVADFQAGFVPLEAEETVAGDDTESTTVDGRTLRYARRGQEGEPVILIHGFGGDLNNWMFNQEALAGNHQVYALDLPGHGRSTKDVGDGSLDTLADVLNGFLRSLEISRAHLVGHSMGGGVALTFSLAHPAQAASLTLMGSTALGTEINNEYIQGFIAARRRREMKFHLQKLFSDPSLVTRQMVEDVLKFKRIDGVQDALRAVSDQFCSGGGQRVFLGKRLGELSMPLLVIWGKNDQIVPASHAQGLPDHIRTEIIPGAGHMVQMEVAGKVNRLILDLVN